MKSIIMLVVVSIGIIVSISLLLINKNSNKLYSVRHVLDGDTILLSNGMIVRYLSVDAPEITHDDVQEECGGVKALQYNRRLLTDKKVRLEKEIEDKDPYGRLLRYVYTEDGTFVNKEMVQSGWAQTMIISPHFRYAKSLIDTQKESKTKKKGIWSECIPYKDITLIKSSLGGDSCLSTDEANQYLGEELCVAFEVKNVSQNRDGIGVIFLTNGDNEKIRFTVSIFPYVAKKFEEKYGDLSQFFSKKKVEVYGLIRLYRNHLEIIANDPNQITITD